MKKATQYSSKLQHALNIIGGVGHVRRTYTRQEVERFALVSLLGMCIYLDLGETILV